jgi:two-component system chemotaxis response regulator CheB
MYDVKESVKKDPIRVMIVDDSAIIRGFLMKALSSDAEITILTTAANGAIALNYVKKYDIEVLILDIEMPEMDGLTALPELLKALPDLKIIMVSTLTKKNAPVAIKALSLGASDYIEKPTARADSNSVEFFNAELINKVKSLGYSARIAKAYKAMAPAQEDPMAKPGSTASMTASILNLTPKTTSGSGAPEKSRPPIVLRPSTLTKMPDAISIACSTGGPQALQNLFSSLKTIPEIKTVPIFITQHMPPIFTSYLATHIEKVSGIPAAEAVDGETVVAGRIYIAPGDFHMQVVRNPDTFHLVNIKLTKEPPENYCRPSANPMLRTLSNLYKSKLLLMVLTGMGQDGLEGAKEVVSGGGTVIAQDEATSVIWGMPGVVAQEGLCSAVLPLDRLPAFISQLATNS